MQLRACGLLMGLVILSFGACSNAPGGGCGASLLPATTLQWPAPGATGVSPTIGVIYVSGVPQSVNLASGNAVTSGTIDNSPGPTPPPPQGAPANLVGPVTIPALAPASTYTVTAVVPQNCSAGTATQILGSFTTK